MFIKSFLKNCFNIFQREFAVYRKSGFSLAAGNLFCFEILWNFQNFLIRQISASSADNTGEMAGLCPACFLHQNFILDEDVIFNKDSTTDNNPETSDKVGKEKFFSGLTGATYSNYSAILANNSVSSDSDTGKTITPPLVNHSFTDTKQFSKGGVNQKIKGLHDFFAVLTI